VLRGRVGLAGTPSRAWERGSRASRLGASCALITLDETKRYDVIIDRISHEVPYYRAALKRFALEGTYIINNPFWWSADDKFFNFALATKLGVANTKTVLLPPHSYIKDIATESLHPSRRALAGPERVR